MDYVIIVAGGKGLRMGSDIPKQFLPIGGKPVLMRTMMRFREYSPTLQIILVLPKAQQDYWQELCKEYDFKLEYLLANGGETRFHSVQHGLALIPDDAEGVVGVHDGVRPFPSIDVIRNCYETARTKKAVIPVIPVVETVRRLTPENPDKPDNPKAHSSVTVPRSDYRLVQTPQSPTDSPTTTVLQMTPVWSKLLASTSPSWTAIARTSRLPHHTTLESLKY